MAAGTFGILISSRSPRLMRAVLMSLWWCFGTYGLMREKKKNPPQIEPTCMVFGFDTWRSVVELRPHVIYIFIFTVYIKQINKNLNTKSSAVERRNISEDPTVRSHGGPGWASFATLRVNSWADLFVPSSVQHAPKCARTLKILYS